MSLLKKTVSYITNNPIKCTCIAVATVATGGAALTIAGPIAATIGGAGLLGTTATTGLSIGTLSGVALTNASLAAIGGGALTVGGGGIAAGTTIIGAVGAATGAVVSSKIL